MPQDIPPSPRGGEPKARYRIRFRKGGDVRFVSHRDLLRTLERSARRAELPLAWTRGFNPRPRIAVAQALPLGVEGLAEVLEVVLTESLPAADLVARWGAQMPPGLALGEGRELPLRARPAQATLVRYEIALADPPADLPARVAALLAAPTARIERRGKDGSRPVDVRPFLLECAAEGSRLRLALRAGNEGTARPEEVLVALGVPRERALEAEVVRTAVLLQDEP